MLMEDHSGSSRVYHSGSKWGITMHHKMKIVPLIKACNLRKVACMIQFNHCIDNRRVIGAALSIFYFFCVFVFCRLTK